MTLVQMLREKAERYAEKDLLVLGDEKLSYRQLDETSNRVANALIKLGMEKGDRVAIFLSNRLEFGIIYFGIIKAGGVAVPLDTRYKGDELASLFGNFQGRFLITESAFTETLAPILPHLKSVEHVIDLDAPSDAPFHSYRQMLAENPPYPPQVEVDAEDLAMIIYTSGTTGNPKGVANSHRNILTELEVMANALEVTDREVAMMFALPLFHIFALTVAFLTTASRGGTTVMVPGLTLRELLQTMERKRATWFMGVPSILLLMANMPEAERRKYDLSSLRLCFCGGAALPAELMIKFKERFGLPITQVWGLTEASGTVTLQPIDGSGKFGSAGKVHPGWELRIVDGDGRELPPNEPGEIIVKGDGVMKGYYNNPEGTAEALKDGWLYSGDIARVDEDGYLFIMGRKKEMIIVAGQNIYPSDIEDVLYQHPKVAEAAVVGIPNELRGEAVRAVIVLKEGEVATEEEIKRFCRQRMASFKVPKEVKFVASMPKTPTGKIRKEELKKLT